MDIDFYKLGEMIAMGAAQLYAAVKVLKAQFNNLSERVQNVEHDVEHANIRIDEILLKRG